MTLKLDWDGSDLGDITEYYVKVSKPAPGKVGSKLVLLIDGKKVTCFAWKYKDDVPLLIDEMKPLFGLAKLGRHKCEIDGIKLLLGRIVRVSENLVNYDVDRYDSALLEEVFIFRFIFGIISSGECIWYRKGEGVISFKEITISFESKASRLSNVIIKNRFRDDNSRLGKAMLRLLLKSEKKGSPISDGEKRFRRITQLLRIKMDTIARRVSREYVWIGSHVQSRIQILVKENFES
jgi:hypothetical protein